MIEVGAKELPEAVIADAMLAAQKAAAEVCEMIEELRCKGWCRKRAPPDVDDIKEALFAD